MRIDFRSDTVTLPSPGMKQAMQEAPLGDDVFSEDPSINELEEFSAALFGKEAGIFCPSGTMTNQIAIKCHTQPGDEVICDKDSHVYQYEGGGIAFNSGCSVRLLEGNFGKLTAEQISEGINAIDIHKARTTLVSLENTTNRGGGACYELDELLNIRKLCDDNSLKLHLDGARLFNGLIAKRQTPTQFGQLFHTISICLSKGLGAPVGSLLLGDKATITQARRYRKVFGGGMRQAGMLAAAGLYALKNNVERLVEDHEKAKQLEAALSSRFFVKQVLPVETNIVIFELYENWTAAKFVEAMKEQGIYAYAIAKQRVRLVTHLNIDDEMIDKTIHFLNSITNNATQN